MGLLLINIFHITLDCIIHSKKQSSTDARYPFLTVIFSSYIFNKSTWAIFCFGVIGSAGIMEYWSNGMQGK